MWIQTGIWADVLALYPAGYLIDQFDKVKAGFTQQLKIDMDNLFRMYALNYIQNILQQVSQNKLQVPISAETLAPLIAENLKSGAISCGSKEVLPNFGVDCNDSKTENKKNRGKRKRFSGMTENIGKLER